jgi:hypothetical protein
LYENLVQLLGDPDKTFGRYVWWSMVAKHESIKAECFGATRHSIYAYPEKVEGGQRYDIQYTVGYEEFIDSHSRRFHSRQ